MTEKKKLDPISGAQLKDLHQFAENLRNDKTRPVDCSLAEAVEAKFQMSMEAFYDHIGVDFQADTLENLLTVSKVDVRYIVPEIIREAITEGFRMAPIWPSITVVEEQMRGMSQIIPQINMSDAVPEIIGEAETIPLGDISYGHKTFSIKKMGKGLKLTDEIRRYSSINVLAIFLRDFGIKMGHGLDTMAIDVLLNGDQADGSESAPVIGITTPNNLVYKDYLRLWARLSRMGRRANVGIGGEDIMMEALDLPEFKTPVQGSPLHRLNLRTAIPRDLDFFVHDAVPANQQILLDPTMALAKYTAKPLTLETERIVSAQFDATYVSTELGFAKLFRDACFILDSSKAFTGANVFPAFLNVGDFEANTKIQ